MLLVCHAPEIKYVQDDNNTCVLSILDYALYSANYHVAEHDVVSQISSYLSCDTVGFMNRIKFTSDNITGHEINKG